ncbi:hypothetical protein ACLMNJ_29140 [Streptomyces seoulensis]
MPIKSASATVRSRYAEQAVTDLAENRRRQNELTRRLETMRQEETLLLNILSLAEHPAAAPEPAHVPQQGRPRNDADLRPAATTPSPAADGVPAERTARTKAGGKSAGRTEERKLLLRDLLLDLLSEHSEPRFAAELRTELLERHADRKPTPQVVRNTLEALVAKGRIRRHKQGRSVMYTVIQPGRSRTPASSVVASSATV